MLIEFERGYIAGIIDGEGTLRFRKLKNKECKRGFSWNPFLYILSTNFDLIEKLHELLPNSRIESRKVKGNKKPAKTLIVSLF